MRRKLNVMFAAFEAVPFMKTGGLGDVAGSLPQALKEAGCEVRVIIPKFRTMPEEYKSRLEHVTNFYVPLGWRNLYCGIEKLEHKGVIYYFVDNEYYFYRDNAYGYFDDGERIAYFSKAVVECLQYLPDFACDILHCNDWHTALSPVFLREFYQGIPLYDHIKTVFSIHNLKFQGQMSDTVLGDILGLAGIPAATQQLRSDRRSINFMKGAICYSDLLSTVSVTYAQEIQSEFFGEHMDAIFRRRCHVLSGIMNGIDVKEYAPESDPALAANYTTEDPSNKAICKQALQQELGLTQNPDVPIVIMIGRLTQQKGMDLVQYVLGAMMNLPLQFVVLGTGDWEYEQMLKSCADYYSDRMCVITRFDEALSHRMYAGGDILLMPSLFEPCGLSQMIAMHYGTLPVVRETGGLKDSVIPYNEYTGEGTGFSFANYNAHEMLHTIERAVWIYQNQKDVWANLMRHGMETDFSWSRAAVEYMKLYERLQPLPDEPDEPEEAPAEEIEPAEIVSAKAAEIVPVAETAEEKAPEAAKPEDASEDASAPEAAPEKKKASKPRTRKKAAATKKKETKQKNASKKSSSESK